MLKLHSDTLLKQPLIETSMPTHGDHNVLVTHRCAETGESICYVWLGTRSKIACMSWNLAFLLILNSLDFSLFSSFIWKGKKSFYMDAVKEYNRRKKDIALLIVLISSHYFERSERLLSKETAVPRRQGNERLKLGSKQHHKDQISTINR